MKHNSNVGNHNFLKKNLNIHKILCIFLLNGRKDSSQTHSFLSLLLIWIFRLIIDKQGFKVIVKFFFFWNISWWKNECGTSQLRFLLAFLNLVLLMLLTSLEALVVLSVAFWPDCVLSLLLFWVWPFGQTVCCCWW